MGFFLRSLSSCNFDDQMSQNFHRFCIWCICWDTRSENTGLWQYQRCPVPLNVSSFLRLISEIFPLLLFKKLLAFSFDDVFLVIYNRSMVHLILWNRRRNTLNVTWCPRIIIIQSFTSLQSEVYSHGTLKINCTKYLNSLMGIRHSNDLILEWIVEWHIFFPWHN